MSKIEDAITRINDMARYCKILESPDEFFIHMQGHRTELSLSLVAFDIAELSDTIKESLSKHIPKEPVISNYDVAFCPVCKGSLWQNKDESNYCFRCGQKIDWLK